MTLGRPDHTEVVEIHGQYAGASKAVLVDAQGRIISTIYGFNGVPLNVDADGYLTTMMRGLDGAVKRVVAVDSTGKIIGVMQGQEGANLRTFRVDSSGRMIAIMRGAAGYDVLVDANGYLAASMYGDDSGTPRVVAVDGSGNIVGVFKGDDGGTLRTLAVDGSGRLLAVITDPEDAAGQSHRLGAAELAVRLGSPHSYDRRGDVLWYDSFDGNINKWDVTEVYQADKGSISFDTARSGICCAKLHTSDAAGAKVSLIRALPYPLVSRVGFEVSFATPDDNHLLFLMIYIYGAESYHRAGLMYDPANTAIKYWHDSAGWIQRGGARKIFYGKNAWNTMKLVVDLAASEYERLLLNDTDLSMDSYAMQEDFVVESPRLQLELWSIYVPTGAADTYYDDAIITQNEPES